MTCDEVRAKIQEDFVLAGAGSARPSPRGPPHCFFITALNFNPPPSIDFQFVYSIVHLLSHSATNTSPLESNFPVIHAFLIYLRFLTHYHLPHNGKKRFCLSLKITDKNLASTHKSWELLYLSMAQIWQKIVREVFIVGC